MKPTKICSILGMFLQSSTPSRSARPATPSSRRLDLETDDLGSRHQAHVGAKTAHPRAQVGEDAAGVGLRCFTMRNRTGEEPSSRGLLSRRSGGGSRGHQVALAT
jgi:hypothetical protein